jgi:hypothetical protein
MRYPLSLIALALALTVRAGAAVMTWDAHLNSAQEIPPNPSTASGYGTVSFDDSTNVLTLDLAWQGLSGDGMQAHIHCCVASPPGNAGIAVDLWLMATPQPPTGTFNLVFDLDLTNPFRATFTAANGGTALSAFAALAAAMNDGDRAYYNIHTMMWPGGEIRGNLSPVPEPATVVAVLSGLGLVMFRRRLS